MRIIPFIFFLSFCVFASAQKLVINPGVDTVNVEHKIALSFLKQYLTSVQNGSELQNFWVENKKYSRSRLTVDPAAFAFTGNSSIYKIAPHKTILNIEKENEIVTIKMAHHWLASDSITTFCITNHYIRLNAENVRFIYPEEVIGSGWSTSKLRNVTFIFPSRIKFNKKIASGVVKSIENIEKLWGVSKRDIYYFYSDSYKDINSIRGFDYLVGGRPKPSGIAYHESSIIFCSGLGEGYFHEFIHVYLGHLNNKDLQEGLAIFYGGSLGLSLKAHVEAAKDFLINNPEFKFKNPNNDYTVLKTGMPLKNLVQALICDKIYRDDGLDGLKKAMDSLTLSPVLENELNIENSASYNTFLKKLITEF